MVDRSRGASSTSKPQRDERDVGGAQADDDSKQHTQDEDSIEEETTDRKGRKIADSNDGDDEEKRKDQNAAALVLQRNFRGHQTRNKMTGASLDSDDRWEDLLNQSRMKTAMKDQDKGKNDPASRWKRSLAATAQLQRGNGVRQRSDDAKPSNSRIPESQQGSDGRSDAKKAEADESTAKHHKRHNRPHNQGILASLGLGSGQRDEDEPKIKEPLGFQSKQLEQTQWLEMIDPKHRYGSNLKYYHQAWQDAETKDNFFRWLDRGAGKHLSLPECDRDQLEKERITYLSAEQRLNYLVLVDDDGLLRWAHNDEFVDTSPNKWVDAGHGEGIIPQEATEDGSNDVESDGASSLSSSDFENEDNLQENHHTHYTDDQPTSKLGKLKQKFTLKGASQRMLRKTVAKNTWIYVSDMHYNLFVGLKSTGTFQHSSFLSGGRVTCAGLIQCRNGKIYSLTPLSGHYRGTIEHYKAFIAHLDKIGADLSKVRVGKAEAIMWGIEHVGKASKKKQQLLDGIKHILHIGNDESEEQKSEDQKKKAEEDEKKGKDGSDSAPTSKRDDFKRAVFYGRKKDQDDSERKPGGQQKSDGSMDPGTTEGKASKKAAPGDPPNGQDCQSKEEGNATSHDAGGQSLEPSDNKGKTGPTQSIPLGFAIS